MVSIFDLSQGQSVMLEHRDHVIMARQSVNGVFRNEYVLADQVVKYLGGAVYQNSLFFLYLNNQNQMILRNVFDKVVYCRIDSGEYSVMQTKAMQGFLNVLEGKMVIFLISYEEEERFIVSMIFPFERELDRKLKSLDSSYEKMRVENVGLQKKIVEQQLENEELQKQIKEHQSRLAESQEQFVRQKDKYEEGQQNREDELRKEFARKEKEFRRQFEEQETRYQLELQKEEKLRLMIESAKKQYSELMEVATKYRDEAIRWRGKFI